jgi:hypothetical protein
VRGDAGGGAVSGLNPRDNHEELMEFIELQRLLKEADVECIIEAG